MDILVEVLAWIEWFWLLWLGVLFWMAPESARRKMTLWCYGFFYLALSRDSKFQFPSDPGKCKAPVIKKKRIVFVRHGESVWNECFNRGFGWRFPIRLVVTLIKEAFLFFRLDSLFIDSPLSAEGIEQARQLEVWAEGSSTEAEELRKALASAVFVTSILRRAAQTAFIGFAQLLRGGRPIWMLSCLQEISRNVDTLALAGPLQPCDLGLIGSSGHASSGKAPSFPAEYNEGNKSLLMHGAHRMDTFCRWVFSDCSPAALQPTVVVAGHSLWFRTFFQAYLPHTLRHECKLNKIKNCGVVMFDLELLQDSDGHAEYRVVAGSVVSLYGGFEPPKKSKKRPKADAAVGKHD